MIDQLFFCVVGSVVVVAFIVHYILKKAKEKSKKKFIILFLLISIFLFIGRLVVSNQDSVIYNISIISTLSKAITNCEGLNSLGKGVDLAFMYNLVITPIIGAIFIGVAIGGMKSSSKGEMKHDKKEKSYE